MALFIIYTNNFIQASSILLNRVENNCIWIKYDSIQDSSAADSITKFLINNKINKVFFETYRNGEILYKRNERLFESSNGYFNDTYIEGNDTTLLSGYNSLQPDTIFSIITDPALYFINQINSIDTMQIYAWMDMYMLWNKNFYPENKDHFYYKCPECLESDINRRSDNLIKLDKIQSLEWEGVFLSPLHPDVNQYLTRMITEVLSNYNIDGVLLDYIRYQNYYYGYNEKGLQLFEDTYNINPLDLNRGIISKYFGYSQTEIDSIQFLWDNYREIKITELLQTVNKNIEKDSLDHEILVSVENLPDESKNRWYQNWSYWLENNLVDYVVMKNHNLDFSDFNYNNKILGKKYNNKYDLDRIIIGLDSYSDNKINLANKILSLRLHKFNNISLYYYEPYKQKIDWYIPIYNVVNFNIDNE